MVLFHLYRAGNMTECIANHKGILFEQYVVLKRTFCFKVILLTCYVAVEASCDEILKQLTLSCTWMD